MVLEWGKEMCPYPTIVLLSSTGVSLGWFLARIASLRFSR